MTRKRLFILFWPWVALFLHGPFFFAILMRYEGVYPERFLWGAVFLCFWNFALSYATLPSLFYICVVIALFVLCCRAWIKSPRLLTFIGTFLTAPLVLGLPSMLILSFISGRFPHGLFPHLLF